MVKDIVVQEFLFLVEIFRLHLDLSLEWTSDLVLQYSQLLEFSH